MAQSKEKCLTNWQLANIIADYIWVKRRDIIRTIRPPNATNNKCNRHFPVQDDILVQIETENCTY